MFLSRLLPASIRNPLKALDLPTSDRLKDRHIYHLMAIYVLITAPLMTVLPFWIMAIAACIVAIKTFAVRRQLQIPRYVTVMLLIFSIGVIVVSAPILGQEYTGLALLFVFASLKLLETRVERDAFLLMLINMLLITGALMANKTGGFVFVLMLVLFFYNIYIQLVIAQPEHISADIMGNLKWIGQMALMALPFVVLLFMFFPRLEPLWNSSVAKPNAVTGLSDSMSPGQISGLAQSEALAFRVEFKSKMPRPNQLYWRGPILSEYDGKTWLQTSARYANPEKVKFDQNSAVTYALTLTGETNGWVPALDIVGNLSHDNLGQNYTLDIIQNPFKTKFKRGEFTSFTRYQIMEMKKLDARLNTFLPAKIYPKTREFAAEQWQKAGQNPEVFIKNILNYIRQNEYGYYLEAFPGSDDVDQFWFDIKIGYCEHYANALAVMLRSVGVPARIATGYQGGEINPVSGDFEVRQLNAHAWVEVYLDGKGWTRVDPTAAVAPQRINTGRLQGAVQDNDQLSLTTRLRESNESFAKALNYLNAGRAFWDNWVANFDDSKQAELLRRLGIDKDNSSIILIFGALLLIPIILLIRWLWINVRQRSELDEIQRIMRRFEHKLEKVGIMRHAHEPLNALLKRYPDKLRDAQSIIETYQQLRFYPHDDGQGKKLIALLKENIKTIKL